MNDKEIFDKISEELKMCDKSKIMFLVVLKELFDEKNEGKSVEFGWNESLDELEILIFKHWLYKSYHFLLEFLSLGGPPLHNCRLTLLKKKSEDDISFKFQNI